MECFGHDSDALDVLWVAFRASRWENGGFDDSAVGFESIAVGVLCKSYALGVSVRTFFQIISAPIIGSGVLDSVFNPSVGYARL